MSRKIKKYKGELIQVNELVHKLLIKYPELRDSDKLLIVKVYEAIAPATLKLPWWQVMLGANDDSLPSTESITRARRRMQALYPELMGTDDVTIERAHKEQAYREYMRG